MHYLNLYANKTKNSTLSLKRGWKIFLENYTNQLERNFGTLFNSEESEEHKRRETEKIWYEKKNFPNHPGIHGRVKSSESKLLFNVVEKAHR